MANTGNKIYAKLAKVTDDVNQYPLDINNELCSVSGLPQDTKSNTFGDLNYIAPFEDLTACPIGEPPVEETGNCYIMTTNSNGYSEINADNNIKVRVHEPGTISKIIILNSIVPANNINGTYTYYFCSKAPIFFKNDDLTESFNWGSFTTDNSVCSNSSICAPAEA